MSLATAPVEPRPVSYKPSVIPPAAVAPQPSAPPGASMTPMPVPAFGIPKAALVDRINWRMVLLGALALFLIGGPFYIWAREALSGGIINHGDYADVNLKAMSTFDLDQRNGQVTDVPQRFRDLEGKRVALEGEMWAPADAGDGYLTYFQLVYSKTKCCFSGPPLAQHFVDANVKPRVNAEYVANGMVRVWGTLHIKFRKEAGTIKSVYQVDVDKVEEL